MKIALSLFDGMSCGQLALQRAGISVDYYLASEVDKAAISVASRNWPDMVQLGDVREVDGTQLQRPFILMGGSPCQSFSFAGTRKGMSTKCGEEVTTLERYLELKREGFEFQGQSYLFWEYVRILKETKPKYFLLENVKMSKKWENVISNVLGVEPITINSKLVSAQNRVRLYWTNIPNVDQPEDEKIYLKDILLFNDIIPLGCSMVGRKIDNRGKRVDNSTDISAVQRIELNKNPGKSRCLTTVSKDNLLLTEKALEYMNRKVKDGRTHWDFSHHSDVDSGKSKTVVANFFKCIPYNVLKDQDCVRKFYPVECERLQTVPDGYTEGVPNTQRYRMLGNGWTVDVIAHILSRIPETER